MTDDEIIDQIFEIRVGNNIPWKKLMKIALRAAPDETRAVLAEIADNDGSVCRLMAKLQLSEPAR
jgi:hypothetical protein